MWKLGSSGNLFTSSNIIMSKSEPLKPVNILPYMGKRNFANVVKGKFLERGGLFCTIQVTLT
jgi:hypothetical protein